tara:strand:+ start:3009 stop:3254 length:246 start_codon:yes stop_codon:yes gene_type:complete
MTQGSLPPRHTLTVAEYAALEPFYYAQRPHAKVKTWRQMRAVGHKPVPKQDNALKEMCVKFNDTYNGNLNYEKINAKKNND